MNQGLPSPINQLQSQAFGDQLENMIDVRVLLRSVYRYKWGIVGLGLVAGLIAAFYASTLTPIYQASSTLLIEKDDTQIVSIQELYSPRYNNWEYMQTQYQLLRSRNLAERVVLDLGLLDKQETTQQKTEKTSWFNLSSLKPAGFNPKPKKPAVPPTPQQIRQKNIAKFTSIIAGGVQVSPIKDTNLISLSYRSEDPKFAADVVNSLADQFIDSQLEAKLGGTQKAALWLSDRLADLKTNLKQSEGRLQNHREKNQLVDLQGVATLSAQEISSINAKYTGAHRARLAANDIRQAVARMQGASTDKYLTIPAVLQRGLIGQLKGNKSELERNVSELAKRYGPKHPKMITSESELVIVKDALHAEILKVVDGIEQEYQLALRTEQTFKRQLEANKRDFQGLNRVEFQIQELQREVDTNRQLYEMFFTRIQETNQGGSFEKAEVRVVDSALVPSRPVSPNKKRIIMVAIFVGLLGGVGVAVLLGFLDNTIKTPEDAQDKLGTPMLGSLPKVKVDNDGHFDQYWDNHNNSYAESVRTIRTGMVLSGLDSPAKVIVITSSLPGEGKSTTALNLGAAFGHMEKTLVIGADLRRPSIAQKCHLPQNHPGLSNYVSGAAELDECISQFGGEQMFVMPAGIIPSNPLEMLSSQKFIEALEHLKERFDRILIDSAPIQAVSDALILAFHADALIFVVKADSTAYTLAKKSISRLHDSNLPLTGVVLNQFNIEQASKYYGSKYYQYGEYYSAS